MRFKLLAGFALLASIASAQQPTSYFEGAILQTDSVPCAPNTKPAPLTNASLNQQRSQAAVCPDYLIATDRVIYRVRPKVADRAPNLRPDERTQFRLQNDQILVRAEDGREYEYIIVSLMPRTESTGDARHVRLNHLQ